MPPQSIFLRPPFSTYLHFYFLLLSAYPSISPSLLYNHLGLSLLIVFVFFFFLIPFPFSSIPYPFSSFSRSLSSPSSCLSPIFSLPIYFIPFLFALSSLLFLSYLIFPSYILPSPSHSFFLSSRLTGLPLYPLSLSLPSLPISFPPSPPFSLSPPFLHLPLSLSTSARCWSPPPLHNFRLWMRVVWSCKCLHYSSPYSHIMYFY